MRDYLNLLRKIKDDGIKHEDRTGKGRCSIFGTQLRFDLNEGFPLVTTKKIFTKAIIHELLWFIRGDTDNRHLTENGVNIWSPWAVNEEHISEFINKHLKGTKHPDDGEGITEEELTMYKESMFSYGLCNIGPMYGAMWRNAPGNNYNPLKPNKSLSDIPSDKLALYKENYSKQYDTNSTLDESDIDFVNYAIGTYNETIDQLQNLILGLKKRPYSARHVVTAWVPEFVPFEDNTPQENVLIRKGSLAPCHAMFQCFVNPPKEEGGKNRLSLHMYQR